jgi:hypothetical protein
VVLAAGLDMQQGCKNNPCLFRFCSYIAGNYTHMTWIEPAEQMPPIETEVLVSCQWGVCMGETMEDDNGNPAWLVSLGNRYVDCYTVTAWMYKPNPYNKPCPTSSTP